MKKKQTSSEIKIKAKYHKSSVIIVMDLFGKYFFKSFFGPFFAFGFPILLLGILGSLMEPGNITAGILAMSGVSLGLMTLPVAILSLKESVLLKRIGASTVSERQFTAAIMIYFLMIGIGSFAWIMLWAEIFFHTKTTFSFDYIEWGGFVSGYLLNLALGLALGMLISAKAKTQQQAQAIGMLIYFPATFLSGMILPIDLIAGNKVMNSISYALPFRYTTGLMFTSWVAKNDALGADHAQSIFDLSQTISVYMYTASHKIVKIYRFTDMILNLLVPLVAVTATTMLATRFFSWSRR